MSERFESSEFSGVEAGQAIDPAVFKERAANIIRYLKSQAGVSSGRDYLFSEGTGISLQRIVRYMQIHRRTDTVEAVRKEGFSKVDQEELENILKEGILNYEPDPFEMWVNIEKNDPIEQVSREELVTESGEKVTVNYKAYFTITNLSDSSNDVKLKALEFARRLPKVFTKLDEIEQEEKDDISIKFLHRLADFDSNPDNIVVHCSKASTREKVLVSITSLLEVPLREGRVNKGFDFHSSVPDSRLNTSHSGLIAEAIALRIVDILHKQVATTRSSLDAIKTLDEQWLAGWLKEQMEYYGNLSPKALANSILKYFHD